MSCIVSFCQSMQYYGVGFALPVIIAGLLKQGTLTTIIGSLLFNLAFGVTGGCAGARLADRWDRGGCRRSVSRPAWWRWWRLGFSATRLVWGLSW